MIGFENVIGNKQLVTYFRRSIDHKNISHAYILSGEEGMGKMTIARDFAQNLLCEEGNACGHCHSCLQFLSDNHPDVSYIRKPEDKKVLSVDLIREEIVQDAQIRPYQGRYKIYIVENAELMNDQAQNTLLKTIEEPPHYVIIMLLTDHPEGFLQTILSRCIKLRVLPVSDKEIKEKLERDYGVSCHTSEICTAFARGSLGRAITLANTEGFIEMHNRTVDIIKSVYTSPLYELQEEMKDFKNEIGDVLDTMKLWYRDVVVYKATKDSNQLVFKDETDAIRKMAEKSSFRGLDENQNAIDKAMARLKANVSYDLVVELLLLTLKEN